eukprot:6200526-Pleurochrysis_carterae.AAC.1
MDNSMACLLPNLWQLAKWCWSYDKLGISQAALRPDMLRMMGSIFCVAGYGFTNFPACSLQGLSSLFCKFATGAVLNLKKRSLFWAT